MPGLAIGMGLALGGSRTISLEYDAAAAAFFAAGNITDATQKRAWNQCVLDLKATNVWAKLKAVYPLIGGNATKHSYNAKNPALHQMTWIGTVAHDSNGVIGDGDTGYGAIGGNPPDIFSSGTNWHMAAYVRTQPPADSVQRWFVSADSTQTLGSTGLTRYRDGSGSNVIAPAFGSNSNPFTVGFCMVTQGATGVCTCRANGSENSDVIGDATFVAGGLNILRKSNGGGFCDLNVAFVCMGDALNATERAALETAVNNFQTVLRRNVP